MYKNEFGPRRTAAAKGSKMAIAVACCVAAAGCAVKPPDVREQMSEAIRALGVFPVYPMRESMRVGQLWIQDQGADDRIVRVKADVPAGMVLSDELVPDMEAARQQRIAALPRYQRTPDGDEAKAFGTGITAYHFKPDAKDDLELLGMPKYTVAAFDQGGLSGAGSTPFASFFASLGFSRSQYLTVEPTAIQIAELPIDTIGDIVARRCRGGSGVLGNPARRDTVQRAGYGALQVYAEARRQAGGKEFDPQLFLLRRVFYLRGIRYIFNDGSVASAVMGAAFDPRLGPGVSPPAAPVPPATPPPSGGAPATAADVTALKAQVDAVNKQLADLKAALPAGPNAGFAGSFAHATARGIELVQIFDRPLAFGYEPFAETMRIDAKTGAFIVNGAVELCRDFGAPVN
jgi:hypothetical protein